jgi:hypothetical protein
MTTDLLTVEQAWQELEARLDEDGCRWLVTIHGFVMAQSREVERLRRENAQLQALVSRLLRGDE